MSLFQITSTDADQLLVRVRKAQTVWPKRVVVAVRRELRFREVAELALRAVMEPGEAVWIPAFLDGMRAGLIPDGQAIDLTPPLAAQGLVKGALAGQRALDARGPGRPSNLDREREAVASLGFEEAERAVQEWVAADVVGDGSPPESGKVIDATDAAAGAQGGFSPEEAAVRRVLSILGLGPALFAGGADQGPAEARGETKAEAADSLARRIDAFLEATRGEAGGLSPERVRALLDAVLAAWLEYAQAEVPPLIRRELEGVLKGL